ncbi:glycosyl hydrolase family 28-related protein [Streptomyces sp. NPDC005722]
MAISRRRILQAGGALAFVPRPTAVPTAAPAAGRPGPSGPAERLWAEFARAPYTHPQIPWVGQAGHAGGSRHFPRRPVRADVRRYGARPDGSADAAPAINRAIEHVGASGGGTVLVPAGTYRIDDVVRLGHSGVTLRGAGSGATVLRAGRSLTEIIGPYGSRYGGTKSAWSWAGGLVWVCPTDRYRTLTDAIRAQDWPFEGWTGNRRDEWRPLARITGGARRGDRTVTVDTAGALRPGDRVMLRLSDPDDHSLLDHMAGDVEGTAAYDWSDKSKVLSYVPYEWPVRIGAVHGRRVTLAQPLPLDARPAFEPVLTTLVTPVVGSGVEGLTIELPDIPQAPHLLDTGWNGLALQCAWDCWADDVAVVNADNGFLLVATKSVTLRRTRVSGRGGHHPYACREGAHDNLVEDFVIDPRTAPAPAGTQLHGINVEGLSSHNVWSRGRMATGTFDTHRGLPFANVRTGITVDNDGSHGGDASAGPLYGARFAHWNVTVTNGRAGCVKIDDVAPCSATVGISEVTAFGQIDVPDFTGPLNSRLVSYGNPAVTPPNLYEAQRALRTTR